MSAPEPMPELVMMIDGKLHDMRPITPRNAVQDALCALQYIAQFGFLAEALAGNETTMGAQVLQRELAKARALLMALLAS